MPKKIGAREQKDVKTMYNVPVTLRDGTVLYMDVYRPNDDKPYPAILYRTPYLKEDVNMLTGFARATVMAGYGYNVIIQDVRGTGFSQGISDPAGHQDEDGYDTVEEIAKFPWCDGNIATGGASYLGFSQLAVARANPPHLKASCPFMTSWTKFPAIFDFGIFSPVLFGWIAGRAQDREKFYPGQYDKKALDELNYQCAHMDENVRFLPIKDMPAANVEGIPELQFQKDLLENIDNEEYLASIGRVEGFEQVTVPTLSLTGWNDFLRDKTIYNYTQFRTRGGSEKCRNESKLIIGPWAHDGNLSGTIGGEYYGPEGDGASSGAFEMIAQWYDHFLKGVDTPFTSGAPIKLFTMGTNTWRDEYEWPLARTRYTDLYIHSKGDANTYLGGGVMSLTKPDNEPSDNYVYDPMDPCPSDTGDSVRGMQQDQRPIQARKDVLCYTSPIFTEETEITGPLNVEFYASCDCPDTDYAVRVSLIRRDGTAYRLGVNLLRARYRNGKTPERLIPGEIYKYTITTGNTSVIVKPGEAIRLDITSSLFSDADRNMNNFERVGYSTTYNIAHETIYHDEKHPTKLILPVIPQSNE